MARTFNFGSLLNSNSGKNGIQDIISRSTRAVCGTFEREVIVRNENIATTKARLRAKGFIIVGTGRVGPNSTKVWFNPAGVNL